MRWFFPEPALLRCSAQHAATAPTSAGHASTAHRAGAGDVHRRFAHVLPVGVNRDAVFKVAMHLSRRKC
jgi:hypothetical protein